MVQNENKKNLLLKFTDLCQEFFELRPSPFWLAKPYISWYLAKNSFLVLAFMLNLLYFNEKTLVILIFAIKCDDDSENETEKKILRQNISFLKFDIFLVQKFCKKAKSKNYVD